MKTNNNKLTQQDICDIFCYQVNLEGKANDDVVWDVVRTLEGTEVDVASFENKKYGEVCFSEGPSPKYVVARCFCKDENFVTNKEALEKCLDKVAAFMKEHGFKRIDIPWQDGNENPKEDWKEVRSIFEAKLEDFTLKIQRIF